MEVRMDSKKGTKVIGIDPVLAEIQQRLQAHPKEWLKMLEQNPGNLANLNRKSIALLRRWPTGSWRDFWRKRRRILTSPMQPKKSSPDRTATKVAWR